MKVCMVAAAAVAMVANAACGAAPTENEAKSFKVKQTFFSEEYENAGAKLEGSPKIVRAPISNGLLELTGQAVYSTSGSLEFGFPKRHFMTPKDWRKYFAFGFRLYSLEGGSAEILCTSTTSAFSAKFSQSTNEAFLCQIYDCGRKPRRFEIPMASLPTDIMLYARKDGGFAVLATSLADGGVRRTFGDVGFFREEFADGFDARVKLSADAGKTAVLKIDNLVAAEAVSSGAMANPVAFIAPEKEFDPDKAGWKKVFEDEFEGTEIDYTKWCKKNTGKPDPAVSLDGKGHMLIKEDFKPGTTNLVGGGISSRQSFNFGYVEAKVKFTKNNGWWAAFWLYGRSNTNPGVDGSEIDIFEDYYTRAAKPGAPNRPILDHNLHVSVGRSLQSWQYRSKLPGTLDEFYRIGCKWTPFEISYYVNGKLMESQANHSPYGSVTFDARNHAALDCPLHIIFSACTMHGWGRKDTTGFKFPEYFVIDSVRAWEYPRDGKSTPSIAWKSGADGERIVVPTGGTVSFEADVKPAADGSSPIAEAYLFDCGHPVAVRTAPPWKFEIPFTEEYYKTTRYMAPGRSGKVPPWDCLGHFFRLYVRDKAGRVGIADGLRFRIPAPAPGATPWKGKPHAVPGKIIAWQFDEGGRDVGHHSLGETPRTKGKGRLPLLRKDTAFDCRKTVVMQLKTGEWMNYTVDVAKDGEYKATLEYASGNNFPNKVMVMVDGVLRGGFDCPWPGKWDWSHRKSETVLPLSLSAGRHTITLMPVGYLCIGTLTIVSD